MDSEMRAPPPTRPSSLPEGHGILDLLPSESRGLLEPLVRLAEASEHLASGYVGAFSDDGRHYAIPRFAFLGPRGGGDTMRVGLFAGLRGDERTGPAALVELLHRLEADPQLATGYHVYVYPIGNPTGFEDRTELTRSGHDLTREFWRGSAAPEAYYLERELGVLQFQGVISIHSAQRSGGLRALVRSTILAKTLVWPAIKAVERFLPSHPDEYNVPDSLASLPSLSSSARGILTQTQELTPRPFEIALESPRQAPKPAQIEAISVALTTILTAYRSLQGLRQNI
jgi:murein peptide amidase A